MGGSQQSVKLVALGRARRESQRGWYSVDVRGSVVNIDQVDTLRLATGRGPDAKPVYAVTEAVHDGEVVRVRVPEFVDLPDAWLWQYRQPMTHLLVKLREGIAALRDPGLAHDLACGQLTPAPPNPPAVAGFTPAQRAALGACLGRGVHLVWGPPGTGKTRVLTEGIAALIRAGKRVLLVSATNIAVDNALLGVVRRQQHQPGELLRVGPPHHRDVAAHPEICLPDLIRDRLRHVSERMDAVSRQLVRLREDTEELARLDGMLTGYDAAAYLAAQRALTAEAAIPRSAALVAERQAEVRQAADALAATTQRREAAHRRVTDLAPARAAYAEIDRLRQQLLAVQAAADDVAAQALTARHNADLLERERQGLRSGGLLRRIRNRGRQRRADAALAVARVDADRAEQRAAEAQALADRRRTHAEEQTRRLTDAAACTRAELAAADADELGSQQEYDRATALLQQAEQRLTIAQQELLAAEAGRPTQAQRNLVRDADQRQLPTLDAKARALRQQVSATESQREKLEQQHEELQAQFIRLAKDAQGEIIRGARLIATTLARLRVTNALMEGPYDVVLVDEVGAANLPEVLLAVSRASEAAVLLGDFMQLGAVIDKDVEDSNRPEVRQWLHRDVFACCDIRSPQQAMSHPGCTVLDLQHRFGPEIMGLANAVAYDGVLKAGPGVRSHLDDDPEIIFIDVDGLGDIARVRPVRQLSGWWPAGALLSRVLADHHHGKGERTGIVTPYASQVEATLEALRDHEAGSGITAEVGTAHRFQGREFPVVVFDLVEDQYDKRWIAKASRTGGRARRNGIRLFNVAITRAQHRLYLIGSRRRLLRPRSARSGTAIAG